jgi:hypothetical protein
VVAVAIGQKVDVACGAREAVGAARAGAYGEMKGVSCGARAAVGAARAEVPGELCSLGLECEQGVCRARGRRRWNYSLFAPLIQGKSRSDFPCC